MFLNVGSQDGSTNSDCEANLLVTMVTNAVNLRLDFLLTFSLICLLLIIKLHQAASSNFMSVWSGCHGDRSVPSLMVFMLNSRIRSVKTQSSELEFLPGTELLLFV